MEVINKLLEPSVFAIWFPIVTGLLGLHLKQPNYMAKKDGGDAVN